MQISQVVMKVAKRKGLREQTIKTYIAVLEKFFRLYKKPYHKVTKKDILNHVDNLHRWKRAESTINVHVSALVFFFREVLHRRITVNVPYVKRRKRLPTFLTKEEISRLFGAIRNEKYTLMITLLYATGMRVSELVKLKVKDFSFNENYGWVRDGKGGKDRMFIVAQKLKGELIEYVSRGKLGQEDYLFSGYTNTHMSVQSVQNIVKRASREAGITKRVHPHTLRHSFATHLIENGYAITDVQPLLGHENVNTTMIYLHMASPQLLKIESPYDTLLEGSKIL